MKKIFKNFLNWLRSLFYSSNNKDIVVISESSELSDCLKTEISEDDNSEPVEDELDFKIEKDGNSEPAEDELDFKIEKDDNTNVADDVVSEDLPEDIGGVKGLTIVETGEFTVPADGDIHGSMYASIEEIAEYLKNYMDTNVIVFTSNQIPFSMSFDTFVNNKVKDFGTLYVLEGEDQHKIFISLPEEAKKEYGVKMRVIYDDGTDKVIYTDFIDNQFMPGNCLVCVDPIDILNRDKCYVVKITLSVYNTENKRKHYDLDLDVVYDFNLGNYLDPIEYFDVAKDLDYNDIIETETLLESSVYILHKDDINIDEKVYIHPVPENGKYMIRTYAPDNTILDDRNFIYTVDERDDCHFINTKETSKVVLYKLSDKNADAITLYLK